MSLQFLEEITNNFSSDRKIAVGSYGSVYKGEQKNGETFAVKLLHYVPELDDLEFKKEYLNLASLQHKNVVRLIGYCHETRREFLPFNGKIELVEVTKRALCFEYLPNGSLDKCLSDELNGHDWHTRYTIIKGICQGLKYLHEDLESPMYHLDLKPANVLLDENMVAKLADFGLSRLFGGERTQMTKSVIGTIGYVPPEFIDAAIITDKFDIFSLGVVMIKILTGPTGYFRSEEMSSREFTDLVHANWRSRLHAASVNMSDSCSEQVKRCIEIALSCLQGDRSKRPSIGSIVNKLNETETLIQSPDKDVGSSIYKICHCISSETELMENPLNKLFSYTLDVTDNRGKLHKTKISTVCRPEDDASTFEEPIRPKIEFIDCTEDFGLVMAIDVHPTEPWQD